MLRGFPLDCHEQRLWLRKQPQTSTSELLKKRIPTTIRMHYMMEQKEDLQLIGWTPAIMWQSFAKNVR